MKHFKEYIFERYVTIFNGDTEKLEKYGKQVWQILKKCYAYLDGGLLYGNTWEEFNKNYMNNPEIKMWKLVRRKDKITACVIYKGDKGGRKNVAMGYDETEQGKKDLLAICKEDYKLEEREAWAEVSSKAFSSAIKNGAVLIPNYLAPGVLGKKESEIKLKDDGYFYTRKINGKNHTKCIIGHHPSVKDKGIAISKEEYDRLKQYAIQYEKEDNESED